MTTPPPDDDLPDDDLPDDDVAAAEYVLGVTDLAARLAAEARARTDPGFAARIASWQAQFAGLNEAYAEAPAPDLLPKIEARLFPVAPRLSVWQRFRGLGLGVVVIVVGAWFAFIPAAPDFTATLGTQGQGLAYQVALRDGEMTIAQVSGDAPDPGHDYELWIIHGDAAPISLGVMPAEGVRMPLEGAEAGAVLAITLEPKGGSPSGKPTGPVLAAGPLKAA
jgi:anti-sigma-K factor RskA